MTNKKKKSGSKPPKTSVDGTTENEPLQKTPSFKPGVLSMPQLTLLILLAVGISKLMEIRSAGLGGDVCQEYLGEEACSNPSILNLLNFKFHFGLSVALQFFCVGLNCWYNDIHLAELNSLTIVSPLLSGAAIMFGSSVIPGPAAMKQSLVMLILLALVRPNTIPFFSSSRQTTASPKAIPRLVLGGLAILSTLHAIACFTSALLPDVKALHPLLPLDAETHFPFEIPATQPILLWIGVDNLLLALLYAFAWHTFHEGYQRSLLMYVAVVKVVEGLYQWAGVEDLGEDATSKLKATALTTAAVAGLAWFLPSSFSKTKSS